MRRGLTLVATFIGFLLTSWFPNLDQLQTCRKMEALDFPPEPLEFLMMSFLFLRRTDVFSHCGAQEGNGKVQASTVMGEFFVCSYGCHHSKSQFT